MLGERDPHWNGERRFATDEALQRDALQSDLPVLLRFSAEWSGPCRTMGAVISIIAKDYEGRLVFVDVDIDSGLDVIGRFGVKITPTMILLKNGKEVARKAGPMSKEAFSRWLDERL